MQNNTPFSRDLTPDLTRTILSVVKEDYQTRERDRQMANTGQLGSALDSKEKASKKVYGKDGVVAHKSLRAMIKKANWKDEKNRLAVKEDIQTRQRKAEGEKDIKNLTATYKRRIKKMAGIPNPHVPSNAADIAGDRAHDALTNLSNRTAKHETERRSTELYGHRGKIIKKKATVKEGLLGKLKKKVSRFGQGLRDVGGDGPASPSDRLRIARWDRAHRTEGDIQRAHMKHKARATVKEEQEYIELLESALESIAEELECSVEDLIEKADYSKVHYGLPIPKGRIDYLTRAEKAKGRLGGLKGRGKYRTSIADPKNKMGT